MLRFSRFHLILRLLLSGLLVTTSALVLGFTAFADTVSDQGISAKALVDYECDSSEWHFVINQIDDESLAPASIQVVWDNDATEDVLLSKFSGHVAHFVTQSNLDATVTSATTPIYDGWSGQFNLSHGPCGPTTTTSSTTTTIIDV